MDLQDYRGRSVLVTGGLGFIGSNLAHKLVDLGASVTLIDSLIPEYGGNRFNVDGLEGSLRINISDIRDANALPRLVEGSHIIFNLAGQTSHLDSMTDPFTDLEINAKAQLSLLEACKKHNPEVKVVYASTRQIYGRPTLTPVDESHRIKPVDVNGINKTSGEFYHTLYSEIYGIPTTVLRLTNTYGPRMRVVDARQTFLGIWIRNILEGRPLQVFGNGDQRRDFSYVDDCVDAFLACGLHDEANSEVFNVGGDGSISLLALAELLTDVSGCGEIQLVPFPADRKAIDIGDYVANDSKLRHLLAWQPKVSLRDGLERTLDFYRRNLNKYIARP